MQKRTYETPHVEVIQAVEALSLLTGSNYENGEIETPVDYGTWN